MPSLPRVTDVNKASRMFYILYQLSKKLSLLVNLDDLLKISLESIFQVIRADRGLLFLRNKENELYVKLAFSREQGFTQPGTLKVSSTVLKRALEERVAILTSDAMHDPRFAEQMSIVQQKIRSVLCAPLWDDEDSYGTIYLDSLSRTYAFTEDDRALLTGIANLIAIRMKQERLHETLATEQQLRADLAKYHSPDVVDLLLKHHGKLDTGRREVTVLFADIQNSTGLAEQLGEDEVHKLLNHFYELSAEAVFKNHGHVNKFIGDAILGLFNAPLEVSGHEAKGLLAARDMIAAVKKYNEQNSTRAFRLRVGINTGWVIAGNIGPQNRLEYTVIGDAVNVAERLCKVETASSVAVSEDTWKRLNGQFKGKDLGELVLKGRGKPVRIYEIEV
jgi:adenylate cyclase